MNRKQSEETTINKLDIILASKSPRRSELLSQIGVNFRCLPSNKEEVITKTNPGDVVIELSTQKAQDILEHNAFEGDTLIIGADTIVSYEDHILGKPHTEEDAANMLRLLSGKDHQVYTGVHVIYVTGKIVREISFAVCTEVSVYPLSDQDILSYIATGEPMDKAGSYGIQGLFAKYIKQIQGDYNNVVGLPIARLYQEVRTNFGIDMVTGIKLPSVEVKACIFDLDGTVLDTVESIGTTANRVLEELKLAPQPINDYKHFAGDGQIELIKRALRAAGDKDLKCFEQAMNRYIELFVEGCSYRVRPYDGICELFTKLKEKDIKIVIFSNKEQNNVVSVLNKIFGENYFDYILGQRSDHKRKPSGEGIDIILDQIEIDPVNCLYFGDTSTDMMTGKNYGLYTIGVTWGFRTVQELVEAGADHIVDKPEEIYELINNDHN